MGDKHNSPHVCNRYSTISHITPSFPVVPRSLTCRAIIKYPSAISASPKACFTGEIGSIFFLCNHNHNALNGSAKMITNKPLKFCTILGGIFQPSIRVSVWLSAIKVNELPACSKAAQKKITKKATMYSTSIRCVSIFVNDLSVNINMARLSPEA